MCEASEVATPTPLPAKTTHPQAGRLGDGLEMRKTGARQGARWACPGQRRKLQNKDHGHALEGTAFQGVSVFRDPAERLPAKRLSPGPDSLKGWIRGLVRGRGC